MGSLRTTKHCQKALGLAFRVSNRAEAEVFQKAPAVSERQPPKHAHDSI